jgi:hypothetical protein
MGWSANQNHGIKPTCSEKASGNLAWTLEGQCKTDSSAADPWTTLADDNNGCPGQWDSSYDYEIDDEVEDNGTIYKCRNSALFCKSTAPDLRGVGLNYWEPVRACTGTAEPTQAPTFFSPQDGCPEEFDSSTVYGPGDKISVERKDGIFVWYSCKPFPASDFCNIDVYSPLSTQEQCNGELCWPQAWTYQGACTGTYTPTISPTFNPNVDGCPEEYDPGTAYAAGDEVSVLDANADGVLGKIYKCKAWPDSGNCVKEAYKPGGDALSSDGVTPLWKDAWAFQGGCSGTNTPTISPTFNPNVDGCPEEYDSGTTYAAGDKVSVLDVNADGVLGKIYECKAWPNTGYCNNEGYKPGGDALNSDGVTPLWKDAWTFVEGCSGTIMPTTSPTFDPNGFWDGTGCPEEYVPNNSDYMPGDVVSILANEDSGTVWQCKDGMSYEWCRQEGFAPGTQYGGQAWEKVGTCSGTMAPTEPPTLLAGNTNGNACQYKVKLTTTASKSEYIILQADSWASGGTSVATGGEAINLYKTGQLVRNGKDAYKCASYPYNGYCNQYSPFKEDSASYNPVTSKQGWSEAECENVASPILGDTAALEAVDTFNLDAYPSGYTTFSSGPGYGPIFDSSGVMLVNPAGDCTDYDSVKGNLPADVAAVSGATNAGDYFKTNPAAKPCQQCASTGGDNSVGFGFGNPDTTDTPSITGVSATTETVCSDCMVGTTSKLVDGRSECVCDNGATDPWDLDGNVAATTRNQCNKCSGGKKFLGYTHSNGLGVCVEACPAAKPKYVKVTDTTVGFHYVCCTDSTCGKDGSTSANVANCFDGGATTNGSADVCTAAVTIIG